MQRTMSWNARLTQLLSVSRFGSGISVSGVGFGIWSGIWGLEAGGSGFRVRFSGSRVQVSGFRVRVSGCRVRVSGFRISGFGIRVWSLSFGCTPRWKGAGRSIHSRRPSRPFGNGQGSACGVWGSGFRVWGLGFCVTGVRFRDLWFWVWGLGFRFQGSGCKPLVGDTMWNFQYEFWICRNLLGHTSSMSPGTFPPQS